MNTKLENILYQLNPWIKNGQKRFLLNVDYIPRTLNKLLIDREFDDLCLILTGPRRAGKTTLALHLSEHLVFKEKRFDQLLYLNCDYQEIRNHLKDTVIIEELIKLFALQCPVVLVDEVQRLTNPGLFLKTLVDLQLPIKIIATGSSRLELKSKVQESLTGRQLESVILPLSIDEGMVNWESRVLFGSYPRILLSQHKEILVQQLFNDYIQKDIVNFLNIKNSDIIEKLLTLLAHSSGQLVNYSQLAVDCHVSQPTIKEYLRLLEETFIIKKVTPFVGNKRTEITRNPIYYFIDNGFRNQALGNFSALEQRTDLGLLVESFVYQELYKYLKSDSQLKIHYWRTKSGAEVDFVIHSTSGLTIPIEVKYRHFTKPSLSRSFKSFIEAYSPKKAFVLTRDIIATLQVATCEVFFIPLDQLQKLFKLIG